MLEMYLIDRLEAFYCISMSFSFVYIFFGSIVALISMAHLMDKNNVERLDIGVLYVWRSYKLLRILVYTIIFAILYLLLTPSKEVFDIFIESLKEAK